MLSPLQLHVLASAAFTLICAEVMIGPGLWNVERINKCEQGDEDHVMIFDVIQKKFNRTHDAFTVTLELKEIFDHNYSITIDACKYLDGGCKPCHVMHDDDMVDFLQQYAEDNLRRFLTLAGLDPPDFPIEAGTLKAINYIYDYEELPANGMYGRYQAHTTVTDSSGGEAGCLDVIVEFKENPLI